ncbi:Choline/ethanolaminephosphotransferase [Ramicandelaber brevisporus]|nr:Choline/ethanolaminephosphotransferase [Ramicandelaber brevisporus]
MSAYIPEEYVPNLKLYAYKGIDHSLLSRYVLGYYWNQLINIFPLWIAPNMITLLGFMCVVVNMGTLLWYDQTLNSDLPRWMYFAYGIGLFTYVSFDAVDGKQARRVGASGPLGELFDHGCDSLNTTLGFMTMASTMHLGLSWWTVAFVYTGLLNFYISTAEEHATGVLFLGHLSGAVEGVHLSMATHILTGVYGPEYWLAPASNLLPFLPPALGQMQFNHLFVVTTWILLLPTIYWSVINQASAFRAKGASVARVALNFTPFAIFTAAGYVWLEHSPKMISENLILFLLTVCPNFGYTVGQIIVAHVSKAPFPLFNAALWPLLIGAANASLPALTNGRMQRFMDEKLEAYYLWACFVYSGSLYGHFAITVINQICAYLDIWCLSIKPKKQRVD